MNDPPNPAPSHYKGTHLGKGKKVTASLLEFIHKRPRSRRIIVRDEGRNIGQIRERPRGEVELHRSRPATSSIR